MRWPDELFRSRRSPEEQLVWMLCCSAEKRAAHQDAVVRLVSETDQERLARLLARLSITELIGGRILELPAPVPSEFAERVRTRQRSTRLRGQAFELLTMSVVDQLASAGIRALAFKGCAWARQIHGDLGARGTGDVDLLVDPIELRVAVASLEEMGWRLLPRDAGALPLLHETLHHPDRPTVELHWRVHWYEERFARDALHRARERFPAGPLTFSPLDGLVASLLFCARDGFVGLRYVTDAVGWWDAFCRPGHTPSGDQHAGGDLTGIALSYPSLAPPLASAASLLEPFGVSLGLDHRLGYRERLAVSVAQPFFTGQREQMQATASLVDLLLTPPRDWRSWISREAHKLPRDDSRNALPGNRLARLARHLLSMGVRWALTLASRRQGPLRRAPGQAC